MKKQPALSRRKAASLIAGVFAATTSPAFGMTSEAVSTNAAPPLEPDLSALLARSQGHMLELLGSVRSASSVVSLDKAFERFKEAFDMHDRTESMAASADPHARAERHSNRLYRSEDPAKVLARVMVRELDAWPKTDAGWLGRLSELERVVTERMATPRLG